MAPSTTRHRNLREAESITVVEHSNEGARAPGTRAVLAWGQGCRQPAALCPCSHQHGSLAALGFGSVHTLPLCGHALPWAQTQSPRLRLQHPIYLTARLSVPPPVTVVPLIFTKLGFTSPPLLCFCEEKQQPNSKMAAKKTMSNQNRQEASPEYSQ